MSGERKRKVSETINGGNGNGDIKRNRSQRVPVKSIQQPLPSEILEIVKRGDIASLMREVQLNNEILFRKTSAVYDEITLLMYAIRHNQTEIVKYLCSLKDVRTNIYYTSGGISSVVKYETAMTIALQEKKLDIIKCLVDIGEYKFKAQEILTKRGKTALFSDELYRASFVPALKHEKGLDILKFILKQLGTYAWGCFKTQGGYGKSAKDYFEQVFGDCRQLFPETETTKVDVHHTSALDSSINNYVSPSSVAAFVSENVVTDQEYNVSLLNYRFNALSTPATSTNSMQTITASSCTTLSPSSPSPPPSSDYMLPCPHKNNLTFRTMINEMAFELDLPKDTEPIVVLRMVEGMLCESDKQLHASIKGIKNQTMFLYESFLGSSL